ncbi:hypothetical protein PISL3812_06377 [Talaromyces islandicus]|uniref:Uncharacterized protein n=1 Tax=Talaromyces islandicus TaxID=28573 RepID=A0A0U1M2Y3_TALIS|nr:hypothetical protein PISL3812_06377 [Talaromyces islandicus]
MPSPVTPRRDAVRGSAKSTPTKSKTLDIGKPLGLYDTNSVREKVRIWQQKGGGVVTPKDALADDENDVKTHDTEKEGEQDEENKPIRSKLEGLPETPRPTARKTSKKVQGVENGGIRKRSQSTPRKRVISDQHWRKQRSPPANVRKAAKEPPKRITTYKTNEQYTSSSSSLPEKKPCRKDYLSEGASPSKLIDDGIRVYAHGQTPRNKSRTVKTTRYIYKDDESPFDKESSKDTESSVITSAISKYSEENEPTVAGRLRRNTPPPEDDDEWARSEADFSELSRRRRRGVPEPRTIRKTKGGLLNQVLDESRKMFAKPAPPPQPPVNNRGDKIAAWLSGQPDPFVDGEDDRMSVDIPAPLKTRSELTKRSVRSLQSSAIEEDIQSTESGQDYRRDDKTSDEKSRRRRRSSGSLTVGEDTETLRKSPPSESSFSETRKGRPISSQSHSAKNPRTPDPTTPTRASHSKNAVPSRDSIISDESSEVSASDIILPLRLKRPFPSTGIHRLSTIASEETLSTRDDKSFLGSESKSSELDSTATNSLLDEERDYFDPNPLSIAGDGLKRKLTKHDDLMSVLSEPRSTRRSVRSSRSIRSNRTRLGKATMEDLMNELTSDETKYLRELRTLVGGVIPVLLSCVLSRSDSAIAAGLFRPSADPKDEMTFTRPIVDMGVALERLKTLHKRIPLEDCDALLNWAQGAQRVYRDYLKAWRMGFQDVVVNLAPLDEEESAKMETQSLDQGMERDESGDVVDSNGEKVDVAYLLKRPLVRLKYLSKTFKGIDYVTHSPKAQQVAENYQELVEHARRRSNEERARLEDESAACIDGTRVRDPETLKVLPDITINKTRRVLARDFFNLSLLHSSGQTIDCHAELLLRDNAPGTEPGGDLLICEIDDSDRWLLFPPIETNCVSARSGSAKGEIVVMIRGTSATEDREWRELLSLTIPGEDVRSEWIHMIGLDPVPPTISRSHSFLERARKQRRKSVDEKYEKSASVKLRLPSPSEVDVPIGEQGSVVSRAGNSSITNSSGPSALSSNSEAASGVSLASAITRASDYSHSTQPMTPTSPNARESLPSAKELGDRKTTEGKASPGLKRTKAKRRSRHADEMSPSENSPKASSVPEQQPESPTKPTPKSPGRFYESSKPIIKPKASISRGNGEPPLHAERESPNQHRLSSVPSMKMPTIPKIRQGSGSSHSNTSVDTASDDEEWPDLGSNTHSCEIDTSESEEPPPPPPHRSPSQAQLKNIPVLSPSANRQKRRSSSPLKHEYEPSTASDTSSESDSSTVRHYDMGYSSSGTSDSSDEELEDDDDILSPIPPTRSTQFSDPSPPASLPALDGDTLSPSNSASQGPYRSVPSQPSKSSKAIGSIFYWAEQGKWEPLFPAECDIMVTPGLIEAYEMSTGPNNNGESDNDTSHKIQPLIALELTPLVPIRRGTAIDISIRSPPTERSRIRKSNNIMFRSRNLEECEALYALINQARINNPTYIALQNARGPYDGQPAALSRYDSTGNNKTASWFGFPRRKNSYRASRRPPSIGMASESSVGTMSSAFSALKRFGTGNKLFSIARSTITSRTGSRNGSVYSSTGGSGLTALAEAIKGADGIGLSNAKIRFYFRESTTKWRDLGAARLTIMPATPKPSRPSTSSGTSAGDVNSSPSRSPSEIPSDLMNEPLPDGVSTPTPAASPRRVVMSQEKRILVQGKTAGEVLLDVCLGESSFERIARTGIAVSVWEDRSGGTVQNKGGVTGGAFRIYMIQMKSEAEAAYTFGLVGKLRY